MPKHADFGRMCVMLHTEILHDDTSFIASIYPVSGVILQVEDEYETLFIRFSDGKGASGDGRLVKVDVNGR